MLALCSMLCLAKIYAGKMCAFLVGALKSLFIALLWVGLGTYMCIDCVHKRGHLWDHMQRV